MILPAVILAVLLQRSPPIALALVPLLVLLVVLATSRYGLLVLIPVLGFPLDVLGIVKPLASGIRSVLPSASILLSDVAIGLLILAVIARVALVGPTIPTTRIGRLLGAYAALAVLSLLINLPRLGSDDLAVGLLYTARMAAMFAPFFLVLAFRLGRRGARLGAIVYLASACVVAAQSLLDPSTGPQSWYSGFTIGLFESRIGLGIYLVPSVVLSVLLLGPALRHSVLTGTLCALTAALATASLVLTHKRAVTLMLFVALGWILVVRWKALRPGVRTLMAVGLAAAIVGTAVAGGMFDRILTFDRWTDVGGLSRLGDEVPEFAYNLAEANVDLGIIGRFVLWQRGVRAALENPLGLGFFQSQRSPYGLPHNQFIQAWAEMSLVGLGVLLVLLWAVFREMRSVSQRDPDPVIRALALAVSAGFAAIAVAGITEQTMHVFDAMAAQWMLVGLVCGAALRSAGPIGADTGPAPRRPRHPMLLAGG